jgi:hypothetical protein
VLDLVRDVRDDLDRAAEVVAAALLADDGVVDRARRDVRAARGVRVREALVVPEVEIGLRAVLVTKTSPCWNGDIVPGRC